MEQSGDQSLAAQQAREGVIITEQAVERQTAEQIIQQSGYQASFPEQARQQLAIGQPAAQKITAQQPVAQSAEHAFFPDQPPEHPTTQQSYLAKHRNELFGNDE